MFISNDNLIVFDYKGEKIFSVFDLPECNYSFTAGTIGQGPDDFIQIDVRSLCPTEKGFKVLDADNQIKYIEIRDKQMFITEKEKETLSTEIPTNGFYPLANNIYLMYGNIGEANEYTLYDATTKKLSKTDNYPQWSSVNKNELYKVFMTYIKNCVVHPNGKMFAAFYGRFKRFRILDDKAKILHDIDIHIDPYVKEIEMDPEKQMAFFLSPQADSKYLYVLCANGVYGENKPMELQVWDWDGRPVACYKLDKDISLMAISEKYHKIYALSSFIDNELYLYDLPEI
jgi:hypothetical protein